MGNVVAPVWSSTLGLHAEKIPKMPYKYGILTWHFIKYDMWAMHIEKLNMALIYVIDNTNSKSD